MKAVTFRRLELASFTHSAVYIALQAKVYYLAPIYPILMAAGAVALERALKPRPVWTVVYDRPVAAPVRRLAAFPVRLIRWFRNSR